MKYNHASEEWIHRGGHNHWQKQGHMSEGPGDWKNHICEFWSTKDNDSEVGNLQNMRGPDHRWLQGGYWNSNSSHERLGNRQTLP